MWPDIQSLLKQGVSSREWDLRIVKNKPVSKQAEVKVIILLEV